jgi:predicted PurR-regulated permease PerM
MTILKLPYAAMSGTLVGVTALIPIVGAFLGAGISAFIIMTENPMQALIFIIFLIILQQFEGNIIYPKVVGDSIGLPGIWVLAAVTVGGGLFGIIGMLIGVPLAATVYKLTFDVLESREKKLGIPVPVIIEKKHEKKIKKSRLKTPPKVSKK